MKSAETLMVTRARFIQIDLDRIRALQPKVMGVFHGVSGFRSASLFEKHDDPFEFMTVAHFASEEDSLKAWDAFVRSPVVEVVRELMSVVPNTQRFYVKTSAGASLDKLAPGTFCSLSTRIADLGFAGDLVHELDVIFEELKVIQGFLGYVTGQLTEVEEEVLGLAFWESKAAFDASVPKKSMYRVDLYCKVL